MEEIPDKSIDVSVIISYDDEANSEKKYFFEIMLSEDGYSIYKGKDSEGKTLSKEEIEKRIALQMSDAERTKYADLILKNDNHFSMLYTILQFDNMLKA